jgi:molecular chaperone DnaK (HSP70)
VENLTSGRKTSGDITFAVDGRKFERDAQKFAVKYPLGTVGYLRNYAGRRGNETELMEEWAEADLLPYRFGVNTERDALTLYVGEDEYDPDELLAMIFEHAKKITSRNIGMSSKDCVITVPANWKRS